MGRLAELLFGKKKEPEQTGVWITNYRDKALIISARVSARDIIIESYNNEKGGAICTTCKKQMPRCWDTVCYTCGDTSCYAHSTAIEGRWYCPKCDPSLELEFRQSFPGWRREEAECFRKKYEYPTRKYNDKR